MANVDAKTEEIPTVEQPEEPKAAKTENGAADLDKKLIRQVEFYFGDFNLHRDKFMQEQMQKNDGWFSMDVMLNFQRLSGICSEPGTILAALKKSKNNLMEVDVENQRIRRKPSRVVPENDAKYRRDLKLRSVYIKGFPQTESIENITEFLEDFGAVEGVQLRRNQNKFQGSAMFKGSLFATFSKLEEAEKFLQAPMVYYQDKELEKMTKDAFWKEKEEQEAQKGGGKKNKKNSHKNDKQKDEKAEEAQEEEQEEVLSFIHVANLTDDAISHLDMKNHFENVGAPAFKFFSRYEKNGPAGYCVYTTATGAASALEYLGETKGGLTTAMKSSPEVAFSEISSEDAGKAQECYEEFRKKMSGGKKFGRRGRFDHKNKRQFNKHHTKFNDNGEPATKHAKTG